MQFLISISVLSACWTPKTSLLNIIITFKPNSLSFLWNSSNSKFLKLKEPQARKSTSYFICSASIITSFLHQLFPFWFWNQAHLCLFGSTWCMDFKISLWYLQAPGNVWYTESIIFRIGLPSMAWNFILCFCSSSDKEAITKLEDAAQSHLKGWEEDERGSSKEGLQAAQGWFHVACYVWQDYLKESSRISLMFDIMVSKWVLWISLRIFETLMPWLISKLLSFQSSLNSFYRETETVKLPSQKDQVPFDMLFCLHLIDTYC